MNERQSKRGDVNVNQANKESVSADILNTPDTRRFRT